MQSIIPFDSTLTRYQRFDSALSEAIARESRREEPELDDFNGISPETRELAEPPYANGSHTPSLINLEASCLDWAPVLAIGEEEHASIPTVAVHPDGNPKAIFCIMNREGRLQNDA